MADKVLSQSAYTAVINAPIEWVDIADWLLNLPDAEYQRCAPLDHIAAGYTTSDDGRPMSINVEQIGFETATACPSEVTHYGLGWILCVRGSNAVVQFGARAHVA
jgi:hypothetical protein